MLCRDEESGSTERGLMNYRGVWKLILDEKVNTFADRVGDGLWAQQGASCGLES
jgi:hypothetical protein